jgi:ribonuclease HI
MKKEVKMDSAKCLFCNRCDEEGAHLFIKCKQVKEAWRILGMEQIRRRLADSLSVEYALDTIWKEDEAKRVQILTFWWIWWGNRNKLREGEKVLDAATVAHQTRCYSCEYMENLGKQRKGKNMKQLTWQPPVEGVLKINFDGAFKHGQNHAGWGVIVRNNRGEVIAASAGRSEHVNDAFHAELTAAEHAVRLAEQLSAIRVVLETDSQLLMMALSRREADASTLAVVLDELKFCIRHPYFYLKTNTIRLMLKNKSHQHIITW